MTSWYLNNGGGCGLHQLFFDTDNDSSPVKESMAFCKFWCPQRRMLLAEHFFVI